MEVGGARTADRAIPCPRCKYDLRGAEVTRCPECGFSFDAAAFQAGVLRSNVPTALDRADPWTIHEVLFGGIADLSRTLVNPLWVLRKMDAFGPLRSAFLGVLVGAICSSLFVAAATIIGIYVHTDTSPAAAVRGSFAVWVPYVVSGSLIVAAVASLPLLVLRVYGAPNATLRGRLRLAGYWTAGLTFAIAVCVVLIRVLDRTRISKAILAGDNLPVIIAALFLLATAGRDGRRRAFAAVVLSSGIAIALQYWLRRSLPTDLAPPAWLF